MMLVMVLAAVSLALACASVAYLLGIRAATRQVVLLTQTVTERDHVVTTLSRTIASIREHASDANAALPETVQGLLAPLLEERRRTKGMLDGLQDVRGLNALPTVLDRLASGGGFRTVLLSDDTGLPIASNTQAQETDALATAAAMVVYLCDRAERDKSPMPVAVIIEDAAHAKTVHRLFAVHGQRYLLSAVTHGADVTTDVLDPALDAILQAMERRPATAVS